MILRSINVAHVNRQNTHANRTTRISIKFALAFLAHFSANLYAVELSSICSTSCTINSAQSLITNHGTWNDETQITVHARVNEFINYGTMTVGLNLTTNNALGTLTNYGTIGGLSMGNSSGASTQNVTINNLGVMTPRTSTNGNNKLSHIAFNNSSGGATVNIANFVIPIDEKASVFNSFSGYTNTTNKNSHLIIDNKQSNTVAFKDANSKIILNLGNDFELGKEYQIAKLITDSSGSGLGIADFNRLATQSSLYVLSKSGQNFIVNLADSKTAGYGAIGTTYKSNFRTMNNFLIQSNKMIFSHKKQVKKRVVYRKRMANLDLGESIDSRESSAIAANFETLQSNETFFYDAQRVRHTTSTRNANQSATKSTSTSSKSNHHFVLVPFVAHNNYAEAGRYKLSGLEYGFLTAFNGKVAPSNALGAHFMLSYGNLNDASDKNFNIKNINLNLGLNYKLDLILDMYVKARGDFFYFVNQVKSLTISEALKPNSVGFGASVSYGKDFNFGTAGTLGIEGGIDYKMLYANTFTISTQNEIYQKSLYHLVYVDLGLNYGKYFNTSAGIWGLNAGLRIKGNVTSNKYAKSSISALNRNIDMVLDNDNILGYANLSGSFVLNTKNFDMEFSLAYYGNYGNRIISNGGGFEWRVYW